MKWKRFLPCISFIFTSAIIIMLFIIKGYAPFGENSLAWMDANIQYLDFFSYLKDIISGENDILYTFSKTLGGPGIAVFSYYLSSPFNLLVVFFEQKDLHVFFDLLVLLKLSLAALIFSFYLIKRFEANLKNELDFFKGCTIVILSVSYALSQYSIAQCSNIMWLDGVYMLPLTLLGVYYIVQGRRNFLLCSSVALTTIFNWYVSGINCLFSGFWLFFEIFCFMAEERNDKNIPFIRKYFPIIKRYLCSIFLGICTSAILFFPTVNAMQNSSKGNLFNGLIGKISFSSIVQKLKPALASPYSKIVIICGCFIVICIITLLFSKKIPRKTKHIFICIIIVFGILCSIGFIVYKMKTAKSTGNNLFSIFVKGLSISGWIPSVIQSYSLGSVSAYGNVSLYCGSFAVIGFISCFFGKSISKKTKLVFGIMSGLVVMLFYWNTFYILFSLFKSVGSYWYRYSYIGIMLILFIAAYFYILVMQKEHWQVIIKSSISFCLVQVILHFIKNVEDTSLMVCTIVLVVLISILALCYIKVKKFALPATICIVCIFIGDISYNASLLMDKYHVSDVEIYSSYVTDAEQQLEAIKKMDTEFYRIAQTDTRNIGSNRITAYYNEAFGYNYNSISGYSSAPDDASRQFLGQLGYRVNDETMCITNTSILAADSLMGVKYVISAMDIKGLEKMENIDKANGKYVYKNPFALPMAFIYENSDFSYNNVQNPFEFQNAVYSALIGRNVELYKPLDFSIIQNGDVSNGNPLIYSVELPDGNYSVYGNIPWNSEINALINVNNVYNTSYSCWLSPSVFYIPVTNDNNTGRATIEVKSGISYDITYGSEQFYALNLDLLKEISNVLSKNIPDNIEISNGYVNIDTKAKKNQKLYLSVPFDNGWKIYLNGKEVSPGLVGECMYSVSLCEGNNNIKMVYKCKGLVLGTIVSIISIILIILLCFIQRRKITEMEGLYEKKN